MVAITYEKYEEKLLQEIYQLDCAKELCKRDEQFELISQIDSEITQKYTRLYNAFNETFYSSRLIKEVYKVLR